MGPVQRYEFPFCTKVLLPSLGVRSMQPHPLFWAGDRSLFFTPSRVSCWRLNVWDFIGWTCSASDILAYREAGRSYSLVSGSASIGREEVIISLFYAPSIGVNVWSRSVQRTHNIGR
jgi:hypothetical protein